MGSRQGSGCVMCLISIALYYMCTSRVAHTTCMKTVVLPLSESIAGASMSHVMCVLVMWHVVPYCRLAYCHKYVISLLPPLYVVSTNSEAKRRQTGMSVYICSVIDISVSVLVVMWEYVQTSPSCLMDPDGPCDSCNQTRLRPSLLVQVFNSELTD